MSEREFYKIMVDGRPYTWPRVTTILNGVFNKPGLLYWAAWVERRAVLAAVEEVATQPGELTGPEMYQRVEARLPKSRAFVKAKDEAADIGTEAHELIRWHTHRALKYDVGPEPAVSDAATRCVLGWMDWAKRVDFQPLTAERVVYCAACGFAGTLDAYGLVLGEPTIIDYKSAKAVYLEALVQVRFYAHAAQRCGVAAEPPKALVIRLPKTEGEDKPEPVWAPPIHLDELQAVLTAWRLARRLSGDTLGDLPMERCA